MKMPEMGPPNEKKVDGGNVVRRDNVAHVFDFEKEKFASNIAHTSEIPEGGAEIITNFSQRKAAREGAKNIAEQLMNGKKEALHEPLYQESEEKRRGSWNMLGALKHFFRAETPREEVERLMRVVDDGSRFVLSQLPYLLEQHSAGSMRDTLAGYKMRAEHMRQFLDAMSGVKEAGFHPTEKDIDELNALSKEIITITRDISARMAHRDLG